MQSHFTIKLKTGAKTHNIQSCPFSSQKQTMNLKGNVGAQSKQVLFIKYVTRN